MEKDFSIDDVKKVLSALANKDHFFVSEAHLQTEFIIEAAKEYASFKFYPELVPSNVPSDYLKNHGTKGIHFDLLIKTSNNQKVLVEFKYITHTYENCVEEMLLSVKSHEALDIRRYDCWKDIERIESFVISNQSDIDYGYFILITNVPGLWNSSLRKNTLDAQFHIVEGEHKAGTRSWREGASKGTTHGRESSINTKNNYNFRYDDFYDFRNKHGLFRSLVVDISHK